MTAGNARFQVLSPTLIRTEYADDGRFVDKPTFNVIGRDAFPRPKFTATQADGWLTSRRARSRCATGSARARSARRTSP